MAVAVEGYRTIFGKPQMSKYIDFVCGSVLMHSWYDSDYSFLNITIAINLFDKMVEVHFDAFV